MIAGRTPDVCKRLHLTGHGRQLYAILADKKRLGRPYWNFDLAELRVLMGVDNRRSYGRFNTFRQRVLDPAVEAINDYGTFIVKMTPQKRGRSVHAVRFDWHWKDPHEATETTIENERHSQARRKDQDTTDAPPLIEDEDQPEAALIWWGRLTDAEREAWAERVGRTKRLTAAHGKNFLITRRDGDIARAAYNAIGPFRDQP